MAKRNDIAPYERREARKWTRVTDYVPDADAHVGLIHWPKPGSLPRVQQPDAPEAGRDRRGLWLPTAAVAVAAILGLWGSGVLDQGGTQSRPARMAAATTTSSGLVFGLCEQGGMRNCVASGDSFYLAGKTVRIANIEAPQLYGATCPREAELGQRAARHLQILLNSGELKMKKVPQDLDGYGLMLRNVTVDGKDVGKTMAAAGLAREIGASPRSWC